MFSVPCGTSLPHTGLELPPGTQGDSSIFSKICIYIYMVCDLNQCHSYIKRFVMSKMEPIFFFLQVFIGLCFQVFLGERCVGIEFKK